LHLKLMNRIRPRAASRGRNPAPQRGLRERQPAEDHAEIDDAEDGEDRGGHVAGQSGFLVRSIQRIVKQAIAARMCLKEWPLIRSPVRAKNSRSQSSETFASACQPSAARSSQRRVYPARNKTMINGMASRAIN